jgi:X-Pro dipeptidyl-peptidase
MLVNAGYVSPYQDARAPFWRQRDYTRSAPGFRAATFIVHGLFDYNVKTNNAGYLWEALPAHLPKKLWLYNAAHTDPHLPEPTGAHPFPFQDKFVDATHRWYAQHLKGIDAGADALPEVEVQGVDGSWTSGEQFPASSEDHELWLHPDGSASDETPEEGAAAYRDAPTGSTPTSVTFVTEPFEEDTRLSGQLGFDLDLVTEGPDTTVAVTVLDVPPGSEPGDSATTRMTTDRDRPLIISYAWLRGWYRDSVPLRGLSTPTGGGPMEPGTTYDVTFGSLYTDLVVPAGHRLAFRFANNAGGTVPAFTGGDVQLRTGEDASRILLPVVGELASEDDETAAPGRRGRPDHVPPRPRD